MLAKTNCIVCGGARGKQGAKQMCRRCYQAKDRLERLSAKQCVSCRQPAREGYVECEKHIARRREREGQRALRDRFKFDNRSHFQHLDAWPVEIQGAFLHNHASITPGDTPYAWAVAWETVAHLERAGRHWSA